ncbi:hypothetical protein ACFLZV_01375 [Candidatus Margulisiibacteriota bacterium]
MQNSLRKYFFGTVLLLFVFVHYNFAEISYRLEDFESKGLKSGVGVVNVGGENFYKASISPDLTLGPVGLGLDINGYMPFNAGAPYPSELNAVTLRHVSYDHNKQFGAKWGWLRSVTFGQGLLMNNFNSGAAGTTEFNNEMAGVLGYATFSPVRVDAMWTAKNVKAARVSYIMEDTVLLGSPIIIGGTYVTDQDGVDNEIDGNQISRAAQDGYGVDVGVPVGGDFLTLFTEYSKLIDHGGGASIGFRGSFFEQVDYRAEYRTLGRGFVPGYFNSTYEATSLDLNTDSLSEQIDGFLISGAMTFMDGAFKGGLIYEKYDQKDLLTAAVGWQKFQNTVGVINYTVPFQGNGNAIAQADILYYTGGWMDYVCHIKRVYITSSTFTESWSVGMRVNLNNLFPKVPFLN